MLACVSVTVSMDKGKKERERKKCDCVNEFLLKKEREVLCVFVEREKEI